jgi:protein-S-isoprenylcysteine O-methyltransferase Ste14
MNVEQRDPIPGWAKLALKIVDSLSFEAPGRPVVKVAWAVNFHKIFTAFLVLWMMFAFNNFSVGAWVYLALHGIYGYCWLIKDFGFRDHQLESRLSVTGTAGLYVGLIGLYWIIPFLFLSRHVEPSGFDLFLAVSLHTLGVVTMIAADGQRHWALKYRTGLIKDGMFRYTRNPNYLGEVMLYSAYAYLANHWVAWLIIAYMTFFAFIPRMYRKDHSLSRYPGWAQYKATSGVLIPWGLLNGRALVDLFRDDSSVPAASQGSAQPPGNV